MKILDSLKNLPQWIFISLVGILIFSMTFGGAMQARKFFEKESNFVFTPLDSIYFENVALLNKHSKLSKEQTDLVLSKAEILQLNKTHHKRIFMKVYSNHYASVTIFPFLSGITVLLSFLIAQNGWKACSNMLKSIFMIFALLTGLYGIFPSVYKQKETVDNNLNNYQAFNKIQNKLFDYSISSPMIYGDTMNFDHFIDLIHKEENLHEKIYYELEHRSIDEDILNTVN